MFLEIFINSDINRMIDIFVSNSIFVYLKYRRFCMSFWSLTNIYLAIYHYFIYYDEILWIDTITLSIRCLQLVRDIGFIESVESILVTNYFWLAIVCIVIVEFLLGMPLEGIFIQTKANIVSKRCNGIKNTKWLGSNITREMVDILMMGF